MFMEQIMSSKILLIGSNAEATREIRNLLTLNKLYKVVQAADAHEAIRKLSQDKFHLIMSDMDVLTEEKMNSVRNFRGLGYSSPVLMLARAIAPKAVELLKLFPKTV